MTDFITDYLDAQDAMQSNAETIDQFARAMGITSGGQFLIYFDATSQKLVLTQANVDVNNNNRIVLQRVTSHSTIKPAQPDAITNFLAS